MSRKATASLGAFLLLYLSWQLFRWIPADTSGVGDVFFLLIQTAVIFACWRASRRCAGVGRLRWFWRLAAIATVGQMVGDATLTVYDFAEAEAPFPSLADVGYLSFYPLMLLALLLVPVAPASRSQRVRLALDVAAALAGGAMVIWHLMVAQIIEEGGQSTLQMVVSVAYPVSDLILLAGLGVVLLRWSPRVLHRPLSLIAAGLVLFIVADIVYGFAVLHGGYSPGGPIDAVWIVAFSLTVLAAASQETARPGTPETAVPTREISQERVSWMPFAALAAGALVLLDTYRGHPFLSEVTVLLAAIGLAALIAVRQYLTQGEMIRLQRDLREAHDQLAELATHDALTSTANRRAIEVDLAEEIARARRYGRNLSVLFLDIDHFKAVNDSLGHAAGDRVLADLASTVQGHLRPTDTLGRWGGEEFVVVLPETGAEEAAKTAERIRAGAEEHRFPIEDGEGLTCSIGVGSYPGDATDVAGLIDVADGAMYDAKRQGRNRVVAANRVSSVPAHT